MHTGSCNFEITLLVSIEYEHLHIGGYTEKNADSLNLVVNRQDYDVVQPGLGVKAAYPMQVKYGTFVPGFHVKWLYDFIADNQQYTSTFSGGGASFDTNGFRPARNSGDIGVRFALIAKHNVEVSLNYDFRVRQDFHSHSGYADVHYKF